LSLSKGKPQHLFWGVEGLTIGRSTNEKGIQFLFAGMKGPVRDLVGKAGWEEKYGERIKHPSIQHALQSIGLQR